MKASEFFNSTDLLVQHDYEEPEIEVFYYWFHHMLWEYNKGLYDMICKALDEKDFDTFMSLFNIFDSIDDGMCYLPESAVVTIKYGDDRCHVGEIDITQKDNFMKITDSECECG